MQKQAMTSVRMIHFHIHDIRMIGSIHMEHGKKFQFNNLFENVYCDD